MTLKITGGSTWLERITAQREEARAAATKSPKASKKPMVRDQLERGQNDQASAKVTDQLRAAGIPTKVAAEHGTALAGCVDDLARFATLLEARCPVTEQAQLEGMRDRYFGALARALGQVPEGDRPMMAQRASNAMLALVENTAPRDLGYAALSAVVALAQSDARLVAQGKLASDPARELEAFPGLAREVGFLAEQLGYGPGTSTALFLLGNIAGQVERYADKLTAEKRQQMLQLVAAFIVESTPSSGLTQGLATELSGAVATALTQTPEIVAALRAAGDLVRAEHRPEVDRSLQQLSAKPPRGLGKGPARKAYDSFAHGLKKIAEAHPTGPAEMYAALEDLRQQAIAGLASDPASLAPALEELAKLLARMAGTRGVEPLIAATTKTLRLGLDKSRTKEVAQILSATVGAPDPAVAAAGLVQAAIAAHGQIPGDDPGLNDELGRLRKLPAAQAFGIAAAVATLADKHVQELRQCEDAWTRLQYKVVADDPELVPVLRYLVDTADGVGRGESADALRDRASCFCRLVTTMQKESVRPEKARALAEKITTHTWNESLDESCLTYVVGDVCRHLPDVPLDLVFEPDTPTKPSALRFVNPKIRYNHQPNQMLGPMLADIQQLHAEPSRSLALARVAFAVSAGLGAIEGQISGHLQQRVITDWATAVANPQSLKWAAAGRKAVDIRAQKTVDLAAYFEAHKALPPEVMCTAGLHLTPAQMAWLIDNISAAHTRETIRGWRNFILACVDFKRLDLVEAARTSASSPQAILAAASYIGREYRGGASADTLRLDAILAGLKAGGDPMAAICAGNVQSVIKGLNLERLGRLDPQGMAEIRRCAEPISNILAHLSEEHRLTVTEGHWERDVDYAAMRAPFMKVVESVAVGSWPNEKYDTAVGRRLLSGSTPEGEAAWRTRLVTSAGAGAEVATATAHAEVVRLLDELKRELPREVSLSGPSLPRKLNWDKASQKRLQALHQEQVRKLHDLHKGAAGYGQAVQSLTSIRHALRILNLYLAIADPATTERSSPQNFGPLRPLLAEAQVSLKTLAASTSTAMARELLFRAADLQQTPQAGAHAVDDDGLEMLLKSTEGGCISHSGSYRFVLVSASADAHTRPMQVLEGDQLKARGLFHYVRAKLPDYKGKVLVLHAVKADSGERYLELMHRHAIAKARSMKVPLIAFWAFSGSDYGELERVAAKAGFEASRPAATMYLEKGNTDRVRFCSDFPRVDGPGGHERQLDEAGRYHVVVRTDRAPKAGVTNVVKPTGPSPADLEALAEDKARETRPVRFRFAPSDTGLLHIGGARTALMSYLLAKKMGGEFLLRIEDTDQARSKRKFADDIMDGLKSLGIEWKGEPVFQSQRAKLHAAKVKQLLDEGKAYRDPTGAVFFKMPAMSTVVFNDRVKGRVAFNTADDESDDFVIQRSDGSATFLLANAVDDGDMGITHVLRGDDLLNTTPRQIALFRALGYAVPQFFHVPLILDDDGTKKLSKRRGATAVTDYRDEGYDPEVLVNHLARLGMKVDSDNTLSMEELIKGIDPWGFSKSPARIGTASLRQRNQAKIGAMDTAALVGEIKARDKELYATLGANGAAALAEGMRNRATTLQEIVRAGRLLREEPIYGGHDRAAQAKPLLGKLLASLSKLDGAKWSAATLADQLEEFNRASSVEFKTYQQALRWALTGLTEGLPLHQTLAIVGKDVALARLQRVTRA
jgi:glutamyl-tRNA synthetase